MKKKNFGKKASQSVLRESLFELPPIVYSKPLNLFLIAIVSIFLIETLVMYVFPVLSTSLRLNGAVLDAALLTILIFPILYFFLLRPLQQQVANLKKAEESMLQVKHDWEDTFNTITDMVTVHDKDYNIIRANKSAHEMLKLEDLNNVLNKKCYSFYHGTDQPLKGCPSCNSLKSGQPCSSEVFEPHLNIFMEIRAIPRLDKNNNIIGLIHVVRDITERKQMEKKLHNISITDEMTGLYNRRGFFNLFNHHLKLAKRQNKQLLLLYADLDNLKYINDTFGHKEGDTVLVEAAKLLKTTYRESDIVARIGGDEFVVFPVGTDEDHVEMITSRLQKNIDASNALNERPYKISVSVGISRYDSQSPHTVDEMLAEADQLMYSHKKNKRSA